VNHCLLEVEVLEAPQVRYTQDNQTPVAEMAVRMEGLRPDDPPGEIKVVGWGNLAQDLQNRVRVGQRLVLEGRLRMNTVARQDGVKEKRAELTLSRLHPLAGASAEPSLPSPAAVVPQQERSAGPRPAPPAGRGAEPGRSPAPQVPAPAPAVWNTSPLVPDDELPADDEIPF
jgi:single-strand DNA-binding protein